MSVNEQMVQDIVQEVVAKMQIASDVPKQAMLEWLAYKRERRESYKPQGLKALLSRAQDCAGRYGGQAVADAIQDSMASNYQGVAWDKLRRRQAPPPQRNRQEVEEW